MPPKKPPPLPRSLFTGGGPLSPSALQQPPSPSTVHPAFITDAHSHGVPLEHFPEVQNMPRVTGSVAVAVGAESSGSGKHRTVAACVIDGPDLQDATTSPAMDLVVPCIAPLTEAGWERVDEAVNKIDGGREKVEMEVAEGTPSRKILVSGLLPPPLTKRSSPLLHSDEYEMHCGHLSQLSLHSDVVLKALPPIVDTRVAPAAWWEDAHELERVVKMYIGPAIEAFGTHRIVFGSQPALPPTDPAIIVPVSGAAWYALLRKCVSELGEESEAMTAIMGKNAEEVYGL
ncbi:hypothetical protein CC85DRAFT_284854 [Cutaneotrichosporon oleaginosum]|uniref:Amidohydrolase-related domain-containing protein n=1 Tax=Cutaneotrichosporon oleaginosum TaxID=879819 RepID=A0A0J1B5V8_9TREE|nr:uncharacterized protein CC85DRAFT_284854 [Cutaneotrichosporon oleaginosum]KLT43099.1 hypothetical protein CC85DRAFT_284854 [Cutaneotrichosporon oleaginosum]TXT10027.1 hypothetical protein COLE_03961 [Cutaneotrichosporon oleaginosum]